MFSLKLPPRSPFDVFAGEAIESLTKRAIRSLQALRESILGQTAEIDAEIQQETLRASETLGTILESDDPETAIRDDLLQIDEFFLNVLGAHLQAARRCEAETSGGRGGGRAHAHPHRRPRPGPALPRAA